MSKKEWVPWVVYSFGNKLQTNSLLRYLLGHPLEFILFGNKLKSTIIDKKTQTCAMLEGLLGLLS